MRQITIYGLSLGLLVLGLVACKKEKKTNDIITHIVKQKPKPKGTQQQSDFTYSKNVVWRGDSLKISIHRYADKDLALSVDEEGQKYYDNKVDVKITRRDGSVFFDKTFSKADFRSLLTDYYAEKSAFVGFMYNTTKDDYLCFGASVGSPNANSDDYMPFDVLIDPHGKCSIRKAITLDSSDVDASQPTTNTDNSDEDGV